MEKVLAGLAITVIIGLGAWTLKTVIELVKQNSTVLKDIYDKDGEPRFYTKKEIDGIQENWRKTSASNRQVTDDNTEKITKLKGQVKRIENKLA